MFPVQSTHQWKFYLATHFDLKSAGAPHVVRHVQQCGGNTGDAAFAAVGAAAAVAAAQTVAQWAPDQRWTTSLMAPRAPRSWRDRSEVR